MTNMTDVVGKLGALGWICTVAMTLAWLSDRHSSQEQQLSSSGENSTCERTLPSKFTQDIVALFASSRGYDGAATNDLVLSTSHKWVSTSKQSLVTAYFTKDSFVHNWFFYTQDILFEQVGLRVRVTIDSELATTAFPGLSIIFLRSYTIEQMVGRAKAAGLDSYMVFLVDDELGQVPSDRFPKEVVAILRPYYFPRIYEDPRTVFVPTGYLFGRGPRISSILIGASQRRIACWFSGSMRHDRPKFVETVRKSSFPQLGGCQVEVQPGFTEGLSPIDFELKMQDTVFALCPAGNSVETIRMYEAWEAGAIPVFVESEVQRGYLRVTHPGFPAIVLSSWENVTSLGEWLKPHNEDNLHQLQRLNIEWYQLFKRVIGRDVRSRLRSTFPQAFAV